MKITTENFINLSVNSDELFKLAEKCKSFEESALIGETTILDKKSCYEDGYTQSYNFV